MLATFPSPTPRQPSPPCGGGLHEVAGGLGEDVGVGELEGDRPDRGKGLRLRVLAEDRARLFAERGGGEEAVGVRGHLPDEGGDGDRPALGVLAERDLRAVDVDHCHAVLGGKPLDGVPLGEAGDKFNEFHNSNPKLFLRYTWGFEKQGKKDYSDFTRKKAEERSGVGRR